MANELKHKALTDNTLTEAGDWEAVGVHIFNSQAKGDIPYASSATQISRLGITNDRILISSGDVPTWSNTMPAWTMAGDVTLSGARTFYTGTQPFRISTTMTSTDGLNVTSINAVAYGPRLILDHGRTTPFSQVNDIPGSIGFRARDDDGTQVEIGAFDMQVSAVGSTYVDAFYIWYDYMAGVETNVMQLTNPGSLQLRQGVRFNQQAYTASGAIADNGFIALNQSGSALAMTLADPGSAGKHLIIAQIDSGTQGHTVTTATGSGFDGTNNTATFNAQFEVLVLVSVSSTRWVIVENIGAVGMSAV